MDQDFITLGPPPPTQSIQDPPYIPAGGYSDQAGPSQLYQPEMQTSADQFLRELNAQLPSWAMAISKVPPYLPYKWVPSMEIKGLQRLNASTQGGNVQKTLWNIEHPSSLGYG
ncbi:hypothetical protein PIB30_054360 [Stylosanthes scabra]|uniref:Uncharacterized protein n=1 Tax=Stylosanthes scabra TaxID=79078 RepID=A0ABU6ZHF1_9FABA|nr:hypothetical protein [Stylosanthes scabra]